MIAYIPARSGSKRIKNKNFYKIDKQPLIVHVIENLKKVKKLNKICISTDSLKIKKSLEDNTIYIGELRKKKLSNDKSNFMDLVNGDINRFSKDDNDVLFILPTAILINHKILNKAILMYKKYKPDILMSCVHTNPFFSLVKKKNKWKPLFKKEILKNTQNLRNSISDAGCFYIFNISKIKKYKSFKDVNFLYPFLIPKIISVDVDTIEDLNELKMKYFWQKFKKNN